MDATNTDGNDVEGGAFRESTIYYLQAPSLTWKERAKKLLLIGLPIVIAILIMGFFAYFLTRDFGHLYPGPAGDSTYNKYTDGSVEHAKDDTAKEEATSAPPRGPHLPTSSKSSAELPPRGPPISSVATSSGGESAGGSGGACAAYEKCYNLGLIGDCCPTGSGIFLSCCQ